MVRARLTPAAFDAAWAEGHAMSLEDAVACALVADDTAFVIDTPAVPG